MILVFHRSDVSIRGLFAWLSFAVATNNQIQELSVFGQLLNEIRDVGLSNVKLEAKDQI
jgi:hypothetical protein